MKHWWKNAVIYQIYPKSFQDSNGDGIGDLRGIIQRLPYLKKLGIDAIWLSPVYKSPEIDNGYDISDYEDIDPSFGTLNDMDELIKQAQQLGIRIVMDLVVNHTSDQHPWFIESKKNRDSPYRNFYIWRDPVNGHEPNNLQSGFLGSAWKYDKNSGQYYLHLWSPEQPDLNWSNPQVREKIYKMINFWINRGISGFRMDAIELIGKDPDKKIIANGPKLHDYLKEMNKYTFSKKDILTVGETWQTNPKIIEKYTDPKNKEFSMVFQFSGQGIDTIPGKEKWDYKSVTPQELKKVFTDWQVGYNFEHMWLGLVLENHDLPRVISRWGNDNNLRIPCAKMFAIVTHMMKGTPFIYQGEEIGMTNFHFKYISEVRDIESKNMYKERLSKGYSKAEVIAEINAKSRDNARTPMQWNTKRNAGFTTGTPWININPNYKSINVDACLKDPLSIFNTYKRLIQLRHDNENIMEGSFRIYENQNQNVLSYIRQSADKKWLIVANLSSVEQNFSSGYKTKKVLLTNYRPRKSMEKIRLKPYEAFVVSVC